jgi:hypothetical protein
MASNDSISLPSAGGTEAGSERIERGLVVARAHSSATEAERVSVRTLLPPRRW